MACFGEEQAITLNVVKRELSVNGRQAQIFSLIQPNGNLGLTAKKGDLFHVKLVNQLEIPTSVHWHGLILPNGQDGVAFVTQYAIYPGTHYEYKFPILQSGTFFMHSHLGLQEQRLLSAPLILLEKEDVALAQQEIAIMLNDFSFKSPKQIYYDLRCPKKTEMSLNKKSFGDIVEVDYDAFLANFNTLENPEIFKVQPNSKIRLRIINASSATNFWISLGNLEGEAITVDGNHIRPLKGQTFELGIAQRIDILIQIPSEGIFPILAQGEGTALQTGFILNSGNKALPPLSSHAAEKAPPILNKQELLLRATHSLLEKPIDRSILVELGGDMMKYEWTLNGQSWPEASPLLVKEGQRVEIVFKNTTTMTHPMHLHGHVFQVTEIDGQKFKGAMRDTVLVGPKSTVKIQFDANNPGVWPLHCHLLYHLEAGMFTVVRYEDYIQPLTL